MKQSTQPMKQACTMNETAPEINETNQKKYSNEILVDIGTTDIWLSHV
jgi:hypothetical protein